jgi:gas vesicle protein
MKTNKGLIISLASAGVAIGAAVVFLTTTKAGKKTMKKWKINGKKIAERADEVLKDARKKIENLKTELARKEEEVVTEA